MSCALCGAVADGLCPRCLATVERSSQALGRLCFNRALELIGAGSERLAEEQLCAACTLLPSQVEPRRALGKLRAQRGDAKEAYVDLSLATRLSPHDEKTKAALASVERTLAKRRRYASLALGALFVMSAVMILLSRWL